MVFDVDLDSGKRWVDGDIIWKRLINFGSLPNNSDKQINIGAQIRKYGRVVALTCKQVENPEEDSSFFDGMVEPGIIRAEVQNNGDISITTNGDYSSVIAYVEIEFCKLNP